MKQVASCDKAEQIKWRDTLDMLSGQCGSFAKGLELARQCRHPDAQWLCSFFPDGSSPMTQELLRTVMSEPERRDDPRARFLLAEFGDGSRVQRSAELGYAPAQAAMALFASSSEEELFWTEKAAAQRDRAALFLLSFRLQEGPGCAPDPARALRMLKEAAELTMQPHRTATNTGPTTRSAIAGGAWRTTEDICPLGATCTPRQQSRCRCSTAEPITAASCLRLARLCRT
jgi:TPR repeat protein